MNKPPTLVGLSAILALSASFLSSQGQSQTTAGKGHGAAFEGRAGLNGYLDEIAGDLEAHRASGMARITTETQAKARQAEVKAKLRALIGAFPARTPLHARIVGELETEGVRIRKVVFESQPRFPVTALLYSPAGTEHTKKRPAVLMTPGHLFTGKMADATMAALLARNGFVVLSWDPIGQGERLQYPDAAHPGESLATAATGEHGEASLQPMLIGDTFARYEIFDALRGIDYLASLPEVDDKRIGAFGCSGGGTVTALASALDARIAATGVACYITSFDALLPALGPQDGEQSSPRFIASGLDFADLIEAAAPRPYAVISTYSDMFPFAGARASVAEARRFYALLDAGAAGVPAGEAGGGAIATPTGPAWNVDTTNHVALGAPLQFITGPGRHGALRPILAQIVGFFLRTLEPEADPEHPVLPPSLVDHEPESPDPLPGISREALQVTKTGQVSTSYPGSETVFTLNRTRAAQRLRSSRGEISATALWKAIRMATGAEAEAGSAPREPASSLSASGHVQVPSGRFNLEAALAAPSTPGPHPAVLFLVPDSIEADNAISKANKARFEELVAQGNVVLAVTPRPSPPGSDDMKSPLLGQFYLLSLRADLVGRTLVGLRVDDAVHAVDFLAARSDVDARRISAIGSGPMGLVLLHAAVLDARLSHVTVDHVLTSYRSLLAAPLPVGAPEDVVPGVLRSYDIPDLVRVLGTRATVTEPLQGGDDLSQTSTPLATLQDLQH